MVEVSNANNEETKDFYSGRGIRDGPLRLNINILENFDKFQDLSVNTPVTLTKWKASEVRQ